VDKSGTDNDGRNGLVVLKAVVFDFGQVLTLTQDERRVNNMQKLSGLSMDEFRKRYERFRGEYDRGVIDGREYWNLVLGHSRARIEDFIPLYDALIFEDIHSWVRINRRSVSFARLLRDRGIKIAILSNMPRDMGRYVREYHGDIVEIFNEIIFSFEIGMIKPEEGIYRYCVERLETSAGDTLFIDDSSVNIEGAKRVGLKTFQFVPGVTDLSFGIVDEVVGDVTD